MIDFTKRLGPKYGDMLNKMLDDSHSAHLGIRMNTPFTLLLVLLMAGAAVAAVYRLIFGIGAASNLNDLWPWGLWIAFDVLGGVAMAAGGFLIAAAVYILNWKKYKCIARASILNAFFGYLLAAISICLDIGRSFVIWHPMVMWQVNSIMFIVAIHVVLYTSTLATESSPMVFEKLGWKRALERVNRCMVGIVLFGVLLSLLHQSSLGAVYLIAPGKLSALWYSKYLPYMFLISAVMMGISMVSFETILTGKVFNHTVPSEVITGLARGVMISGTLYLAMKIGHLVTGPGIGAVLNGSFLGNLWLLEMAVGVVLPLALLSLRSVRHDPQRIFAVNIMVILGVLLNRLNVGIFGVSEFATRSGGDYMPSIMEFMLTAGMVAFAILGFKVCAKYLNLFPETHH
ncbi:NrfD/PsrC family molybdoenzyme membrane anchor subunit [Geobacter sp. SVR]|uniref:NrfD/PsrC family molybdoenzyme membrane anchor subunit n=1 Tax=Geobacter sp. SVR TaxID=2495594 RepID=UPI00143EF4E2|nr:Ni/Fe-hydrogenase cytochrome b subunit [Geobacter sp. SVR]BCS52168.1 Ni/Fe-hydrogenase cytochrome b subunit [Geobacter sp. SVR]GCF86623.1 formate dehydrogenase [Geobacter sp. SVR]